MVTPRLQDTAPDGENAAMPEGRAARAGAVIGVDVGGTKVAAAAIDGVAIGSRVEHPTDVTNQSELLDGIAKAVLEVAAETGDPAAVGIGLPSQIDFASGTVVASANIPLRGVPVRDQLSERFGCPVYVDNDANCAALAESHLAEGGRVDTLVMLTLGTGVGGGVVIGGEIFRGATGLGAELGHVVIQEDGPECPGRCPNRGCLEAFCSGTALERSATEHAGRNPRSALGRVLAQEGRVSGRDVVEHAREGDEGALGVLEELGRHLGVGMAGMINIFEPELLVIGGGLSRAGDLFIGHAEAEARSRALPALSERVTISLARAGADAGVIGAGALAAHELEEAE
jgi:glucokinase